MDMLKGVPKIREVRSTKVKLAPKWGQEQEQAFHALKKAMLTTVPLTLLDTTRICYISPDASDFAIGAALQQKVCKCPESWDINQGCTCPMRPIAFLSPGWPVTKLSAQLDRRSVMPLWHPCISGPTV